MHVAARFRADALRQYMKAVVARVYGGGVQVSEIPWGLRPYRPSYTPPAFRSAPATAGKAPSSDQPAPALPSTMPTLALVGSTRKG